MVAGVRLPVVELAGDDLDGDAVGNAAQVWPNLYRVKKETHWLLDAQLEQLLDASPGDQVARPGRQLVAERARVLGRVELVRVHAERDRAVGVAELARRRLDVDAEAGDQDRRVGVPEAVEAERSYAGALDGPLDPAAGRAAVTATPVWGREDEALRPP